EFFIAGTEPTVPCSLMPGLSPTDTVGFSTYPGSVNPPGGSLARDSAVRNMPPNPMGGRVVPGAAPMPRPSSPRDTFGVGRTQPPTTYPAPPRRDTGRIRVDSVKRTIRVDTIRPRGDSGRNQQQGRRPQTH